MIMNPFLKKLFDIIAIDTEHLNSFLTSNEWNYLNNSLKPIEDLSRDFYSSKEGKNLEVLLHFLSCHEKDIALIWRDNTKKEILLKLYTSGTISGNYECFRFDLSKFDQGYRPRGQALTLYRIGREKECKESLGNSWSKNVTGLRNYAQSSSIEIESRPVFVIEINDSEVLCEGNSQENELILKKFFKFNEVRALGIEERNQFFV
jgi:hypothetical protein